MNSDSDSDWDSMSEAPQPPAGGGQQAPAGTKSVTKQGPATEQAPKPVREEKSPPSQQERVQETGKANSRREYSVSKDSGIDTATTTSSNLTAPAGGESKGDSFTDLTEELQHSAHDTPIHSANKKFPQPEERINLLTFEEIKTQYFQIQFADEGLYVDRIIPTVANCWSRCTSEILGILKIPMIIIFVIIGHILKTLISSLVKPFSDYILKPVLVSLHNHLISPVFSLLYNVSSMTAVVVSPCCPVQRLSSPWVYVTDLDTKKHSDNSNV